MTWTSRQTSRPPEEATKGGRKLELVCGSMMSVCLWMHAYMDVSLQDALFKNTLVWLLHCLNSSILIHVFTYSDLNSLFLFQCRHQHCRVAKASRTLWIRGFPLVPVDLWLYFSNCMCPWTFPSVFALSALVHTVSSYWHWLPGQGNCPVDGWETASWAWN